MSSKILIEEILGKAESLGSKYDIRWNIGNDFLESRLDEKIVVSIEANEQYHPTAHFRKVPLRDLWVVFCLELKKEIDFDFFCNLAQSSQFKRCFMVP